MLLLLFFWVIMLLLLLTLISGFNDVVAAVIDRDTTATIGRYRISNIASSFLVIIAITILKIILNVPSFPVHEPR